MLTVDELRGHVETDLDDTSLGLLLDAAYEAIDNYAGTGGTEEYPATVTEVITTSGDLLMLSRRASAILSVVENASYRTDLETDDYELIGDQMVRRVRDGTNSATVWRGRIEITYTAFADENQRDRVAIGLVELDVNVSPGMQSERLGEWSETHEQTTSYAKARDALLSSLYGGFVAK